MALPYINVTQVGAGTAVLAAPVAGQKIRLRSLAGFLSIAGTIQLQDSAGAVLSGAMNVGIAGGLVWPDNPEGWLETASGKGLSLVSITGAFNGVGMIQYVPG